MLYAYFNYTRNENNMYFLVYPSQPTASVSLQPTGTIVFGLPCQTHRRTLNADENPFSHKVVLTGKVNHTHQFWWQNRPDVAPCRTVPMSHRQYRPEVACFKPLDINVWSCYDWYLNIALEVLGGCFVSQIQKVAFLMWRTPMNSKFHVICTGVVVKHHFLNTIQFWKVSPYKLNSSVYGFES